MATYEVRFRGKLSEELTKTLENEGIRWIGGPGDEPWHPSAPIYEQVEVEAETEESAMARVQDALEGKGTFTDFHAAP